MAKDSLKTSGDRGRKARYSRKASGEDREVGPLRKVASWPRRRKAEKSVEAWAMKYLPNWFPLPCSPAHRDAAALLQSCTDSGGLGCLAMPRGFGKTSWTLAAVLRALLSGRRKFVVLICATDGLAEKALRKIKRELEANDLLDQDYAEATQPVRALERITRRAMGQVLNGKNTRIEWNTGGLTLPTSYRRGKATPSSGGIVHAVGITGAIRGLSVSGPNGEILRPDCVILDDVQTRESAKSPTQSTDRESIITDDVLGLAGPTVRIAAAMLATPIYENDLAERFLDPQRHPEWRGRRSKMLAAMPTAKELWDEYGELRKDGQRAGDDGQAATAFYIANRGAMDAGAIVTWAERMTPDTVSGLQSAMNLAIDNPRGFKAEYQCEPEKLNAAVSGRELHPSHVAGRLSGVPRLTVPKECSLITTGIDVGGSLLWWVTVGWSESFAGRVLDYGVWPGQTRAVFAASDAGRTLKTDHPGLTDAQRVFVGLQELVPHLLGRVYYTEAGGELKVVRCLIDAGFESAAVQQFVRQSSFSSCLLPSKGVAHTATARGVMQWKTPAGGRKGHGWILTQADTGRGQQLLVDPDFWKTVVADGLAVPMGGRTGISLFGKDASAHELFAEHLCAEYGSPATYHGLTFCKWTHKPHRPDNHLLDAAALSAASAGLAGLTITANPSGDPLPASSRPTVSAAEAQQRARARGPVNASRGRRLPEFA